MILREAAVKNALLFYLQLLCFVSMAVPKAVSMEVAVASPRSDAEIKALCLGGMGQSEAVALVRTRRQQERLKVAACSHCESVKVLEKPFATCKHRFCEECIKDQREKDLDKDCPLCSPCVICLDEQLGAKKIIRLVCGHDFHDDCIELDKEKTNRWTSCCPLCRCQEVARTQQSCLYCPDLEKSQEDNAVVLKNFTFHDKVDFFSCDMPRFIIFRAKEFHYFHPEHFIDYICTQSHLKAFDQYKRYEYVFSCLVHKREHLVEPEIVKLIQLKHIDLNKLKRIIALGLLHIEKLKELLKLKLIHGTEEEKKELIKSAEIATQLSDKKKAEMPRLTSYEICRQKCTGIRTKPKAKLAK